MRYNCVSMGNINGRIQFGHLLKNNACTAYRIRWSDGTMTGDLPTMADAKAIAVIEGQSSGAHMIMHNRGIGAS